METFKLHPDNPCIIKQKTLEQLFRNAFGGKTVLITGGLGFLGSSLVVRLSGLGAKVSIVDVMIPEYGGNFFNIDQVKDQVSVNFCDIRDEYAMNYVVRDQEYVFHCAAQVCHLKSLSNPYPDIDINIRGTTILMEALRQFNPRAKVIKLGSRGQYGSVLKLPASEDLKPEPKGIYEISLLAAEHILSSYHRVHGIPCWLLRLTNTYGPRAQMLHNRFGVANWFVRLALDNEVIPVFGDGSIKRDFLYVDDCIEAILRICLVREAEGQVINVGSDIPSTFRELAETLVRVAGSGRWEFHPFSDERSAQEPGDFYSDINKISTLTGWRPTISLEEGLRRTVDYYRQYKQYYWQ